MSSLSERIWYGEAQHQHETAMDWRGPVWVGCSFAALVLLRLVLPFEGHSSLDVYREVVWALSNQQNWGRQALVASLDYPPLPLIGLLILAPLSRIPWLDPGHLLVAISQVWTFTYLVRLASLYRSRRLRHVLGALLFVVLLMGPLSMSANPFWLLVVVMASVLYHLCRWEITHSLRDLVVVSLNCGVLVLGGIEGIVFGGAVLLTVWLRGDRQIVRKEGGATLLALPYLYTLLLYPLFNWLIMGNAFFWVHELLDSINRPGLAGALIDSQSYELQLLLGVIALAGLLLLLPRIPLYTRVAGVLAALGGLLAVLRIGADIYIGGEYLLMGFVEVPLLLFFLYYDESKVKRVGFVLLLMGVNILLIGACVQYRGSAMTGEKFAMNPPAPAADELLELVDTYWMESRILVYDLRTASLYVSEHPDRFRARLDYRENELRSVIRDEQFHLLIPPNNGKYYPKEGSPLGDIHEHGRRWLLLEKEWPGGWQLWRCIRPRPNAD